MPAGFDRLTTIYDPLANFFSLGQINKSQEHFIFYLTGYSSCVLVGGGTGRFLQKLLAQNNEIVVTYVEASSRMLEAAKKRIAKNLPEALPRVRFVCSDAQHFDWGKYEVIVCNYFLDLFQENEVRDFAKKFRHHLNPEGILYITDFSIPEKNKLLTWGTRFGLKLLYGIFRSATGISGRKLPEIDTILKEQDFVSFASKKFFWGVLETKLFTLNENNVVKKSLPFA